VLARLARFVGDLNPAGVLAQDTFVPAIGKWRQDGVPDSPAAWLHTTARYLAADRIPTAGTPTETKVRLVTATSPQVVEHDHAELVDGDLADDLLGLIFMAASRSCHRMHARRSPSSWSAAPRPSTRSG
jgi:predicted RNA polymerase sigma factor